MHSFRREFQFFSKIAPNVFEQFIASQRFIGISADIVDRDMGSAVADLQERLKTLPVPDL